MSNTINYNEFKKGRYKGQEGDTFDYDKLRKEMRIKDKQLAREDRLKARKQRALRDARKMGL